MFKGQQGNNPNVGQMPNAMVGQMNPMQMNMQGGGQMGSMNNMNMPMTINSSLPNQGQNQINAANMNQSMNPGQQINPNQMTQMLNRINSVQGIVGPNAPNAGNQMNQPQLVRDFEITVRYYFHKQIAFLIFQAQINPQMMSQANIQANINQPNVPNVIPNVSNASTGPNVGGPAPNITVPNVNVSNVNVPNVSGPTQLPGTGPMNNMNQINAMNMHNMGRGQPGNVLFQQGSKLNASIVFPKKLALKNIESI